jgi:AcrR family transcriptional regulator
LCAGALVTQTTATDTRQLIIDAAQVCFRQFGMRKTTVVDIGRAAGLSRGTVYLHFRDKAAIVEACAESASQRFYRGMARAMDGGGSLADKLSRAAMFVSEARRVLGPDEYFDEDQVSLLLAKDGELLRECVDFIAPYLAAAKLMGEVRKDLDTRAAGEWFARILFSLFSMPSSTLDMDDPAVVRAFVQDHVVRGFR